MQPQSHRLAAAQPAPACANYDGETALDIFEREAVYGGWPPEVQACYAALARLIREW